MKISIIKNFITINFIHPIKLFIIICFTLINHNSYGQIVIGAQTWINENASATTGQDGTEIIEAKTHKEWLDAYNLKQPAWCYYDNNPANKKYGKIYNLYAVNINVCPVGYHVPSEAEWRELIDNLGGYQVAGKKLKSTSGFSNWEYEVTCPNCKDASYTYKQTCSVCKGSGYVTKIKSGNGTNSVGFNALPGGRRPNEYRYVAYGSAEYNIFDEIGTSSFWWSTTKGKAGFNNDGIMLVAISNSGDHATCAAHENFKGGYYVRCLKNSINNNEMEADKLMEINDANKLKRSIIVEKYNSGDYKSAFSNLNDIISSNGEITSWDYHIIGLILINKPDILNVSEIQWGMKHLVEGEKKYRGSELSNDIYKAYISIGWNLLLKKEFVLSCYYSIEGLKDNPDNLYIQGNLAHAYLLTGQYERAKMFYLDNIGKYLKPNYSWKSMVIQDFKDLQAAGISNEHFEDILNLVSK